jgi:hypothetical protein
MRLAVAELLDPTAAGEMVRLELPLTLVLAQAVAVDRAEE